MIPWACFLCKLVNWSHMDGRPRTRCHGCGGRRRSTMHSLSAILEGRMQAFPAQYRGVLMRSQLEADFAHYLDSIQAPWEYEPQAFSANGEGYLPDFRVGDRYIEVKPTLAEVPLAQTRMEVIWLTEPAAILVVACGEECRFYSRTLREPWTSWVERWRH